MEIAPIKTQRDYRRVQTIPFGGISLGPHQSLDLLEDASVIPLRLDWCDLHVQALYSLCVGLIILTVRTNETDINDAVRIVDPDHNTIFVARNIEHGSAV